MTEEKDEKEYIRWLVDIIRNRLTYIDRNPNSTISESHDALLPENEPSFEEIIACLKGKGSAKELWERYFSGVV